MKLIQNKWLERNEKKKKGKRCNSEREKFFPLAQLKHIKRGDKKMFIIKELNFATIRNEKTAGKSQATIAMAGKRKEYDGNVLSIRNGSQTMHFHSYYAAVCFMSAVVLFSVRLAINKHHERSKTGEKS
jgi:hypothetical protein